ncbi:MAG TPA: hypothetical protein VKY90_03225 [Candidatus Dormibacteraeota bacterium]|nr:hypothetical protein [Candidatus Dormibacteraeota bacterium]
MTADRAPCKVRLVGAVVEIESVRPPVRVRTGPGRLPVLEVDDEVPLITDADGRAGLEAQREERERRWR